jgi:hypothetical protein
MSYTLKTRYRGALVTSGTAEEVMDAVDGLLAKGRRLEKYIIESDGEEISLKDLEITIIGVPDIPYNKKNKSIFD